MKTKKRFRLALVGTDSLRGQEIINILSQKEFPLESFQFFDPDVKEEFSKLTQFQGEPKVIHSLDRISLENPDLVFLAADDRTNEELGKRALKNEFQAIDLSGTFNKREEIPLVVAGMNDGKLGSRRTPLVASPHPVTIILSHVFRNIFIRFQVLKVIAFVLQPVSAFDRSGIDELASQSVALLSGASPVKKVFKEQIAFNILSHTEKPDINGFSSGERLIISELKRIFVNEKLPITLSVIQAPLFHTYSIMTFFELKEDTDIPALSKLLVSSPFIKVSHSGPSCPVSSISVAGKEDIFIGQIKKEENFPRSFWVWAVADNLTRGSALNAFEVAKRMLSISRN